LITRGLRTSVVIALALAAACAKQSPPLTPDTFPDHAVIRRDRFGVPHILADSPEAAAFAFGYAQAEDHFLFIARQMIAARGEEARNFGSSGRENDFAMARLDNLNVSRKGLEEVGPQFRRILEGYAAGINQYSGEHASSRPPWVREFDAADVMAQIRSSAVEAVGSPALVRRLREKYERFTTSESAAAIDEAAGSNALALHGTKTTTGKPILLGNPHLNWSSRYWEAHITIPGRMNFYGSTLAGLPVLRAGFNEHLGFVQTNNAPDLEDVSRLQLDPAGADRSLFDGRQYPLQRRDVRIEVKNESGELETESRTYWTTHLGPVVHRDGSSVFALASARLDAWRYFEGFHLAAQARSLEEFLDVMRLGYVPTSNFTYADAGGNIMYLWNARLPRRLDDGSSYELDVPGVQKYLWRGFHALDDLPRLVNPAGGYVQNANNPPRFASLGQLLDMTRYPRYVERGELGLRPQLALAMLEGRPRFSVGEVMALKFDTRMLLAERVKPALVKALQDKGPLSEVGRLALTILTSWDDKASRDSRGALLFTRFWDAYASATRQPFAIPWDPARPAETPSGLADAEAAIAHLERAVASLRESYGSEDVAWGQVNRYRLGEMDLPAEGCSGTYGCFRVQRFVPAEDGRTQIAGNMRDREPFGFGDAWVLLVDFSSTPPSAWSVLAYGQTTELSSAHSQDQIALFAERKLRRVPFTEDEIRGNLEREYRPGGKASGARIQTQPRRRPS
jgi:acyl-homoserine-lactone acylase